MQVLVMRAVSDRATGLDHEQQQSNTIQPVPTARFPGSTAPSPTHLNNQHVAAASAPSHQHQSITAPPRHLAHTPTTALSPAAASPPAMGTPTIVPAIKTEPSDIIMPVQPLPPGIGHVIPSQILTTAVHGASPATVQALSTGTLTTAAIRGQHQSQVVAAPACAQTGSAGGSAAPLVVALDLGQAAAVPPDGKRPHTSLAAHSVTACGPAAAKLARLEASTQYAQADAPSITAAGPAAAAPVGPVPPDQPVAPTNPCAGHAVGASIDATGPPSVPPTSEVSKMPLQRCEPFEAAGRAAAAATAQDTCGGTVATAVGAGAAARLGSLAVVGSGADVPAQVLGIAAAKACDVARSPIHGADAGAWGLVGGAGAAAAADEAAHVVPATSARGSCVAVADTAPATAAACTAAGVAAQRAVQGPGFAARPPSPDTSSEGSLGEECDAAGGSPAREPAGSAGAHIAARRGAAIITVGRGPGHARPAAAWGPGMAARPQHSAAASRGGGPGTVRAVGWAGAAMHASRAGGRAGPSNAVEPGSQAAAGGGVELQGRTQHAQHTAQQDGSDVTALAAGRGGGAGVHSPCSSNGGRPAHSSGAAACGACWSASAAGARTAAVPGQPHAAQRPVKPCVIKGDAAAGAGGPGAGGGDDAFLLPLLSARREGGLCLSAGDVMAWNARARSRLASLREAHAHECAYLNDLLVAEAAGRRAAEAELAQLQASVGGWGLQGHNPV
eukprot:jgi/Ulvmu1/8857/UM049_0039.1